MRHVASQIPADDTAEAAEAATALVAGKKKCLQSSVQQRFKENMFNIESSTRNKWNNI